MRVCVLDRLANLSDVRHVERQRQHGLSGTFLESGTMLPASQAVAAI